MAPQVTSLSLLRRCACLVACLSLVPLALPGNGATPIYQPTVISSPGKYVVTRSFDGTGTLIDINASHVELDLNGFRLQGGTTDPVIRGSLVTDVKVHGGSVIAGNPGVYFEYSSAVTLERLTVLDSTGIGVWLVESSDYVLRDSVIKSGQEAIHATAAYGCPGTIERNRITGSGSSGPIAETVLVQGASGSKINGNTLMHDVYSIGIHLVACDMCEVSGNILEDFGGDTLQTAIQVNASTHVRVERNSSSEGIILEGVTNTTVARNKVRGILINDASHSNRILSNRGLGCQSLQVEGDRNLIESNVLNDTACYGLYFTSSAENNVYRANVATGNLGTGCSGTGTTDFCDEGTGNTSAGDNFMPAKM